MSPDAPVEPVVAAPVAAPAVEPAPAPVAVASAETSVVEPVAAAAAAPTEVAVEKVEPVVEPTSLLQEAGKKPEVEATKGEAAKVVEPEKPAEPVAAVEPAPVAWDFKLPEILKADEPTIGRFKENLEGLLKPKEGETASHAANRLLDMHAEAMIAYDKQVRAEQVNVWNETKKQWRTQAMADAQIGGAGHATAMGAIARVRDTLISDANPNGSAAAKRTYENDVREFDAFLAATGAGDHPAFLKFVHRAARYVDEPSLPTARAAPPPDAGKKPSRSLYE